MVLLAKKGGSRALPGSPFAGREAELERFRELCEAVDKGNGAVVAISGDHGVGNYVKLTLM